ncbi:hypothetical protein [Brevundimonas sp. UBA5936]|uniref:hypothetical protein n=1 Tax=Brevundimonas sp. UBA5936 TaxID=1946133 RepID=UPI0025C1AEE1|nr:hypothetical protein [Brevundimonas sp. UBA5936]
MTETSDFEIIAAAWLERFGSPMPVAGEIELAWRILTESGVDLPPPAPPPPPSPESDHDDPACGD